MRKLWFKLCSLLLVAVLLANMLPLQTFAEQLNTEDMSLVNPSADTSEKETATGKIVEELTDKRTEYTKQFRMDNGLFIAAVYNDPVHYEKDGQWLEIDNTLKAQKNGTYINSAGVWNVSFPNQLTRDNRISVTKDTYTLSFGMAGELRTGEGFEVMSAEDAAEPAATAEEVLSPSALIEGETAETFAVAQAQAATAQLESVDLAELRAAAEYPEMVADKLYSGLQYQDVYGTTDIRYQLNSNKIKESVILESYSSTLRGYRYTLEVGDLNPVLQEDGSIHFYDAENKEIVMVMEAPFLVDDALVYNYDVQVLLTGSGNTYTLTYLLPTAWLASADRAWPVVLDPVVTANLAATNIQDQTVASKTTYSYTRGINECGYSKTDGIQRFYLQYNTIPTLTSSDVVVSAKITMHKFVSGTTATVQVHKVLGPWQSSTLTWANKPAYDPIVEDYQVTQAEAAYVWDVTDIVRGWYENANYGMMFRVNDTVENGTADNWKQFCSSNYSDYPDYMPTLQILFRNNSGLESYWDYTTSSAGRAGIGYVNNFTGNLTWTRSDMGFGGNRMPVSISHIYNLNDAGNNEFGLGYGWRTNFNQTVEGIGIDGNKYYIWEDADGTSHYFYNTEYGVFKDEDGLELTLRSVDVAANSKVSDAQYSITDKLGNASFFDTSGRLIRQRNNQSAESSIIITYDGASKRIKTITDGANRVYAFTYDSWGLLTNIKYKGKNNGSYATTQFAYSANSDLTQITDTDGKTCYYTYNNHILYTAQDIDGYKLQYSYYAPDTSTQTNTTQWRPYRVSQISAVDGSVTGGTLNFAYSRNQTVLTDHNGNKEILQFNDFGNMIAIHDGQGRAQYAQFAINNEQQANSASATQKANQLTLSSKLQNTVVNHIRDTSFELYNSWTSNSQYVTVSTTADAAYMGAKGMKLTTTAGANSLCGACSNTVALGVGETLTFSAYIKTSSPDVTVALHYYDGSAYHTVSSAKVIGNNTWNRAEVSFTNNTTQVQNVCAYVFTPNAGTTYVDCTQLEKTAAASRYNLVDNGDFQTTSLAWSSYAGRILLTDATGNALPSGAPQMDSHVYQLVGNPTAQNRVSQNIPVSGAANDTFVFAGWAKGNSVPLGERDGHIRQFAILMRFNYTDGSTSEYFSAQFNADSTQWQYVAAAAVATKAYSSVTVYLAYDYNMNSVCFDGIQLFREEFGNSYTYDANGNVTMSKDTEGEKTTYTYDNKGDLKKAVLPTGVTTEYTYDNHHNVKTITIRDSESGPVKQTQTFTYDGYGNLLTQSTTSGGITTSTTMVYTSDGNRLQSTTDAVGNVTNCWYNEQTNVLEWVQYPGDTVDNPTTTAREGTATYYGYDSMYRTTSVSAVAAADPAVTSGQPTLFANYTYNEKDQLDKITTGSTVYDFDYGTFGLRNKVKVGSTTLASYNYTNDQNKYLQSLVYGNGDSVQYTYDTYGRVTKQTYEDGTTVSYLYDNDGALASVYDSETGITTKYYYDFTGRTGATELRKNADLVFRVSENFDEYGRLTSQSRQYTNLTLTDTFTYNPNGTLQGMVLGNLRGIGFTYDGFDRLTAMNTGSDGVNGRTFTYRTVGTQTTSQISSLNYHELAGKTGLSNFKFSYTYDQRGNIATYTAPGEAQVTYAYDTQNQLLSANGSGYHYTYTYDDAGNITKTVKNGTTYTYTYGNSNWGDLLTKYNGTAITYDTIGNPTSYYNGWNFTWKQGREMATATKSGQNLSFTYNADGLRTTKTVNGVVHTYYYSGSKLVRETYGDYVLDFFYDQNGTPFMLLQNGNIYYYITNAQGDVIRLVDINGNVAASYRYDPYGKAISALGSHANINPLRYRGYVFDHETGLYYLQSRYYDPEIGRFINADALVSTGQGLLSNNMFAYCLNNPVSGYDPTGHWNWSVFTTVVATLVATVTAIVTIVTVVSAENHIVNAVNQKSINNQVKDTYTKEEAKEEIDNILSQYSSDDSTCAVTFDLTNHDGEPMVEISNSYKVNSRYDRQKICTIISNTEEVTAREYDNMSSEWLLHNIMYPIPFLQEKAISAGLDYHGDYRPIVSLMSTTFEFLGWE